MRNVIVVVMLAMGLVLIVVGASRADDSWQICYWENGSWHPWVSPRGYMALPRSQTVCLLDLANARNVVGPNIKLDCVKVNNAGR